MIGSFPLHYTFINISQSQAVFIGTITWLIFQRSVEVLDRHDFVGESLMEICMAAEENLSRGKRETENVMVDKDKVSYFPFHSCDYEISVFVAG